MARDFLVKERPDVVIQVVDASNLERNFFLLTQLMELGVKLVIALNMTDVAKNRGLEFDLAKLEQNLRAPIVPTVGNKRRGIDALLAAVAEVAAAPTPEYQEIQYPKDLSRAVDEIDCLLSGRDREYADRYPPRWLAARLFENDPDIAGHIADPAIMKRVGELRAAFERDNDDPPEIRAAEAKYGWIAGLSAEAVRLTPQARSDMSDKVDKVILHRVLGLPIFLGLMYLMFHLVFTLAEPPMEWIETLFGHLGQWVRELWPRSADSPLRDLLADGILSGVGGVLVFLPNIVLLFLVIAFLEGTGYMARAAFIMDHLMQKIGLHGKSFIPMLLGFGCTVPAIMGCRTLENRRDRLTTILVLPFMSCGARLPIYALIIPAFFPEYLQAWMLWLIYIVGIVFAIVGAKLLRSTVFKGDSQAFVMELPPYRMPTARSVLVLMWERAWEYCKKAGTIILGASILLWAMTAYPKKEVFNRDYDAERETAYRDMAARTGEIGAPLGLGGKGGLLASWADAYHECENATDRYWENETGYQTAVGIYREKIDTLEKLPGGDKLRVFIAAFEGYGEIASRFAAATEGEEKESEAYQNAAVVRDRALAVLQRDAGIDQPTLFAAMEFRDGALNGYRGRLGGIAHAENGEQLAYSVSGRVGRFLEPVLKPVGFDWRIGTAIIGSFAAKEVFVAQLGIVYSVGSGDENADTLREKLRENYTPLQAFCMMLYCLLSVPCVATIAVTRREAGGWHYALGMVAAYTLAAYLTTLVVFQAGSLLGIGM